MPTIEMHNIFIIWIGWILFQYLKRKFKKPNICNEKIIIINPAKIRNSFENRSNADSKNKWKPSEKRIVLVKTIDLSLSIS